MEAWCVDANSCCTLRTSFCHSVGGLSWSSVLFYIHEAWSAVTPCDCSHYCPLHTLLQHLWHHLTRFLNYSSWIWSCNYANLTQQLKQMIKNVGCSITIAQGSYPICVVLMKQEIKQNFFFLFREVVCVVFLFNKCSYNGWVNLAFEVTNSRTSEHLRSSLVNRSFWVFGALGRTLKYFLKTMPWDTRALTSA